jgi:hypothetical protein
MILDERNEFCDATSAVLAVGNAIIGDVIDLGTAGRDIGNGEPLYLVIQVDTAFVGATSTTQFQLCSDSRQDQRLPDPRRVGLARHCRRHLIEVTHG